MMKEDKSAVINGGVPAQRLMPSKEPTLIESIYKEPLVIAIPSHAAIGGRDSTL